MPLRQFPLRAFLQRTHRLVSPVEMAGLSCFWAFSKDFRVPFQESSNMVPKFRKIRTERVELPILALRRFLSPIQ
jgi:hypothetical protein